MADIVELLEQLFKARIDERGRMYIPKVAREKLSLKSGDRIYLKIENGRFIAYTLRAIRKQLVRVKDT